MDISYNKNHSAVNKFIYDSQTGTLINHEKRAKILLSNKEKEDIYSYFTQQEFSSQCISVIHQDSTSSKITIDLKKINFKDGVTRKLDLGKDQQNTFAGDATDQFKIAKPFEFLGPGLHH